MAGFNSGRSGFNVDVAVCCSEDAPGALVRQPLSGFARATTSCRSRFVLWTPVVSNPFESETLHVRRLPH